MFRYKRKKAPENREEAEQEGNLPQLADTERRGKDASRDECRSIAAVNSCCCSSPILQPNAKNIYPLKVDETLCSCLGSKHTHREKPNH